MGELDMWTVYDHPRDFPELFVARRWTITAGGVERTDDVKGAHTLQTLQDELVDMGLTCVPRFVGDDPVIVEVWL